MVTEANQRLATAIAVLQQQQKQTVQKKRSLAFKSVNKLSVIFIIFTHAMLC